MLCEDWVLCSLLHCLNSQWENRIKKGSRHTASKWQNWHLWTWPWDVHTADEVAVFLYLYATIYAELLLSIESLNFWLLWLEIDAYMICLYKPWDLNLIQALPSRDTPHCISLKEECQLCKDPQSIKGRLYVEASRLAPIFSCYKSGMWLCRNKLLVWVSSYTEKQEPQESCTWEVQGNDHNDTKVSTV